MKFDPKTRWVSIEEKRLLYKPIKAFLMAKVTNAGRKFFGDELLFRVDLIPEIFPMLLQNQDIDKPLYQLSLAGLALMHIQYRYPEIVPASELVYLSCCEHVKTIHGYEDITKMSVEITKSEDILSLFKSILKSIAKLYVETVRRNINNQIAGDQYVNNTTCTEAREVLALLDENERAIISLSDCISSEVKYPINNCPMEALMVPDQPAVRFNLCCFNFFQASRLENNSEQAPLVEKQAEKPYCHIYYSEENQMMHVSSNKPNFLEKIKFELTQAKVRFKNRPNEISFKYDEDTQEKLPKSYDDMKQQSEREPYMSTIVATANSKCLVM